MVDTLDDSQRVRNDGVRAGGAEVIGRKAFQNFVGETVRGVHGQLQGRGIGHTGAIEVGCLHTLLLGECLDLRRGPVHERYTDVQ